MPRPEKEEAVRTLKDRLLSSEGALLTEFRGIKVDEMKELRRSLREAGAEFRVVKNTLGRIAVKDAGLEDLLPFFEGSTAIAFIEGDPVTAARGFDEMATKFPTLVLKGGLLEGQVLDAQRAAALAKIKPREEQLATLAGMLRQPLYLLAGLMKAPIRDLGLALAGYREKLQQESPPPEPEPQAEEEEPEAEAEEPEAEAEEPEAEAEEPATEGSELSQAEDKEE